MLYLMLIVGIISLLLVAQRSLLSALLIGLTLVLIMAAKVSTSIEPPLIDTHPVAMHAINLSLFVLPLLAVIALRDEGDKRISHLLWVLGGAYVIMYVIVLVAQGQ